MYRIRAQSGKGDIPLGFYCPKCKSLQNIEKEYLIPANLITRLDPFFKMVSKRETYLAILGTGDRAVSCVVPDKMIEPAQDRIGSALASFCKPLIGHGSPRLNRDKTCQDFERDFNKNIRTQELKKAAASQKI